MKQLNYFQPYNKGTDNHEDHLTRAFLVLLKLSPAALQQFYSYVHTTTETFVKSTIPPLHEMQFDEVGFQSQIGSLPISDKYISLLITNENVQLEQKIKPIERTAIYDGVIQFNEELVFIIETKPNKNNVWENQLCPARKDIPEEAELIDQGIVLEWKQIINFLHRINESKISFETERIIINDFLNFVAQNFDYLNPYNEFSKCHSQYLASKRIEQILEEIAFDKEKIKHHSGWGYYLELDFPEIKKIGLLLHSNEKGEWNGLTIAADFGSTVSQAREFYQRVQSYNVIQNLEDWSLYCNLHLAFRSQNLLFFKSPENSIEQYFNYWKSDVWDNFGGVPKDKLIEDYLLEYEKEGILIFDAAAKQGLDDIIMKKKYSRINICPAIYIEHYIARDEAVSLDKEGNLVPHIKIKITELLSTLNRSVNNIIL